MRLDATAEARGRRARLPSASTLWEPQCLQERLQARSESIATQPAAFIKP